MTLAAFALIAVAVVAMVLFLRREVKRAVDKLTADSVARQELLDAQQRLLYKQGKAGEKQRAQTERVAAKVLAQQHDLQKKTRDVHLQVQTILLDPKIQDALRRAEEVS
jgi:hypothetical protein